jgi:hypothetical protein
MESRRERPLSCLRVGQSPLTTSCCARRCPFVRIGSFAKNEEFDEAEEDESEGQLAEDEAGGEGA